jgi:hypothetical protein
MERVLDFVYTDSVPRGLGGECLTPAGAERLFGAADMLLLFSMKVKCASDGALRGAGMFSGSFNMTLPAEIKQVAASVGEEYGWDQNMAWTASALCPPC